MSKVNYAKIRNSQKRADTNPEEKTLAPTSSLEVHSSACGSLAVAEKTSFPLAPPKIESSNLTNLFGDNVHMDNLDYINSLLGNQFAGNTGVPQKRKKTKPKLDDSGSQPKLSDKVIMPSSPVKANDPLNVPLNSPGLDPSSSIISPYEIENNHVMENIDRLGDNEERAQLRAARNMSNMISRKDVEMYEEYFQNDVNKDIGKRSMSVEDVRILKRDFSKASASAKAHGFAETEGDGLEDDSVYMTTDPTPASIMQDFGHNRPLKSDFSSKIGQYIDYFQKSEQSQYRMRKASQYLGTNPNQVNSRTESQRSGQSRSNDVEKMMNQIKKLKAKVDELQVTNELLLNERKTWKKMEHEIVYRAQNAETEIAKAHSKAKKYKEKLKYTQELLQREKLDNENNLLALRRVLANNISTVLEHKIHHYMNSDRDKPYLEQARMSNSEKGGATKKVTKDKDYRKNTLSNVNPMLPGSTNQTRDVRYGEGNNVKNRWKNTSLKDKMSPLLSQKDQSFSDDDENPPERLTTLSKSDELDVEEASNKNKRFPGYSPRQSDFETSSELTDEFQYYFYGNHQEPSKKLQQIQYLQNQLTKLMEKDENLSQSTSNYSKSASQRNADQMISSKQRTNPSSSYSKKAREPTYSKLNNYTKQHEHVRLYRKDLDDTLSPNEALNHPSFSNSESGWTTSLGK